MYNTFVGVSNKVEYRNDLLRVVQSSERVKMYMSLWERNMELIYGEDVLTSTDKESLFVDLTIYVTVVKVIGSTVLEAVFRGSPTIPLRLANEGANAAVELFWSGAGNNLFERDEYEWVFDPDVAPRLDGFFRAIGRELSQIDWSHRVSQDLLKRVYLNVVSRELRKQLGEYYTPDWIAKLMIWRALHILRGTSPNSMMPSDLDGEIVELIDEYYRMNGRIPSFIDPTCGSFTFGVQYLNALMNWYHTRKPNLHPLDFVNIVLESVVGIDLNPVAVLTAKVNYLLQIYGLLVGQRDFRKFEIPIYRFDLTMLHNSLVGFIGDGEALHRILSTKFDLVLGNLPWVNVSNYPSGYRERLKRLARELNVNPSMEALPKMDISIILFAISARYLSRDGGVIALMMPVSVFKGLHGASWRDFSNMGLTVVEVFDLQDVKPFDNANNQPGIVFSIRRTTNRGANSTVSFRCVKFSGLHLSPKNDREPEYGEVLSKYVNGELRIDAKECVSLKINVVYDNRQFKETLWLSKDTYDFARKILAPEHIFYEAHTGVSFTSAKGTWEIVKMDPIDPPTGVSEPCVRVETRLSRELGLPPFVVEKRFVFRGFKGEDVEVGRVKKYRYFIAPYDGGNPLSFEELRKTLLWKNYLNNITKVLEGVSRHMKKSLWNLERMGSQALARYKVVWRDVAREFIPAVVTDGAVPDYTVNYVVVDSLEEAYYLMAILLAPQINAVVRELASWVGHVQPRFIRYFKIPKYDPNNEIHRELAKRGKEVAERMVREEIQTLVEKLV